MRPLESSWPVAFYSSKVRVPLSKHLAAVTLCAAELFSHELPLLKERLSSLFEEGREGEKQEERLPHSIGRTLLLAAALHDLAKASPRYYYAFLKKGSGKISFMYHELASAYIVYRSAVHESREMRRIFWTAAKVIARHHAAMEGRHPQDIGKVRGGESLSDVRERVSSILQGLWQPEAQKVVDKVIEEVRSKLEESSSRFTGYVANEMRAARDMLDHVRDQIPRIPRIVKSFRKSKGSDLFDILRRDVEQVINILAKVYDEDNKKNYYPIIAPLSGALIIADNLVADYERRTSDDKASPIYMRHWQKELMRRGRDISSLSCLQYVESYVSKSNAPALP
ncbi:MAG: CRISPR-associated endonuclease Cas3'' [Acidilobaceae archaeon]|nr:CRISPR-associated endonuclease Cas3'' [Acidilobaceae archaeon]MCX8165239.1 CRISPR-associated endonuclease Cas3'' [Acidilobaceae archaeon]MDW7973665.1 CRISPR-associated endonuclease Cas3'' [Sulfolobales archaeon]